MTTMEPHQPQLTETVFNRVVHAGIGLTIGIVLYVLSHWWQESIGATAMAFGLSLGGLVALVSFRRKAPGQVALFAIGLGLLVGLMDYYMLRLFGDAKQMPWLLGGGNGPSWFAVAVASVVIAYVGVAFFQTWLEARKRALPYERLFVHAWSNFLLVAVAKAFTLAAWLVLALWMGLFGLVEITVFKDVFTSSAFVFPFTGAVFGLSMALAKEYDRLIFALRNLALTLCRFLAPVLAVAAILFLCVLPFTGLTPLWNTGAATPILLIVMMASVLAVNAVVQYGQEATGFPALARYPVMLELAVLPIFAVLAFYSTWLRVEQHGLTPERVYALLIVVIAGLHVLAYSGAVILKRGQWWRGVIRANPVLALLTVLLLIAVHVPGITPYHLSARNQYDRLAGGTVKAADFDFGALKFNLGQPGRDALARIEANKGLADREVVEAQLEKVAEANYYSMWSVSEFGPTERRDVPENLTDLSSYMVVRPEGTVVPAGVIKQMNGVASDLAGCQRKRQDCALLALDADGDGQTEYLFITVYVTRASSRFIVRDASGGDDAWSRATDVNIPLKSVQERDAFYERLQKGDFTLEEPRYKAVRIGDVLVVPDALGMID